MDQFLGSVSSSVIAAIIVGVLGIGSVTIRVITGSANHSKLGDRLVGTAWIILIVGAILFGSHNGQFTNLQANDVWAMLGADLMGLSPFVWGGGKLARLFLR